MKALARWMVSVLLVVIAPIPAGAKLPYCGGIVIVRTYNGAAAEEAFVVTRFMLDGNRLRVWVVRKVLSETLKQNPAATIDDSKGIGYQLDDNGVAGIQLDIRTADLSTVLSFSNLRRGHHHLRVGLLSPQGEIEDYQDYCFSSPGSFTLTNQ